MQLLYEDDRPCRFDDRHMTFYTRVIVMKVSIDWHVIHYTLPALSLKSEANISEYEKKCIPVLHVY